MVVGKKYAFEKRGKSTVRTVSRKYAMMYHEALDDMVEQRMRAAINCVGDLWYSAWVDAGMPDLELDVVPRDTTGLQGPVREHVH